MRKFTELTPEEAFTDEPLGAEYTSEYTTFRVWAPLQDEVILNLYDKAESVRRKSYPMKKKPNGVFEHRLEGNLRGKFYTYSMNGLEVTDPYSKGASLNSTRSAIVDLENTNPPGFKDHVRPVNKPEDAIIYEMHLKDFTGSKSSGNVFRGKFLSLTQRETTYQDVHTGLGSLKELGVTHVHLMPIFDYLSVEETPGKFFDKDNYNWGYDPELYNVPEGSYSVDARDPELRIREVKEMVQALHEAGMSVVMDVVYNHTYRTEHSNFNSIMPDYYYRQWGKTFSNASGCGNELASERPMVRRFILDSLRYWQEEFKVDGFRFDLMGIHDRETIYEAVEMLRKNDPNVLIYGEPWMALDSSLPYEERTLWGTQVDHGFALFNAPFRDALKGDNDGYIKGYIQGDYRKKRAVEGGISGSLIEFGLTENSILRHTTETINYFNSHDNLILQDKLLATMGEIDELEDLTKLAFGILLTSLGIPFFHAGNEFMRDKKMNHNSYNKPLEINAIDWSLKEEHLSLFHWVADLIAIRKQYSNFHIVDGEEAKKRLIFLETFTDGMIAYVILGEPNLLVVHNALWEDGHLKMEEVFRQVRVTKFTQIFGKEGAMSKEVSDLTIQRLTTQIYKLGE